MGWPPLVVGGVAGLPPLRPPGKASILSPSSSESYTHWDSWRPGTGRKGQRASGRWSPSPALLLCTAPIWGGTALPACVQPLGGPGDGCHVTPRLSQHRRLASPGPSWFWDLSPWLGRCWDPRDVRLWPALDPMDPMSKEPGAGREWFLRTGRCQGKQEGVPCWLKGLPLGSIVTVGLAASTAASACIFSGAWPCEHCSGC